MVAESSFRCFGFDKPIISENENLVYHDHPYQAPPEFLKRLRLGEPSQKIYESLLGVGQAADVIVVTPEDIERYRHAFCLVVEPALREGKVVYERGAVSAG